MLLNFVLSPGMSLLPLFVTKHLHGGAMQLGWLEAAVGGGIVLGGLLLAVWGGFRRRIVTVFCGIVGMGAGVLALGFAPANGLWIAVGAFGVVGAMNALANGPLQALLQSHVDPGMQGRVFTLLGSLATAMSPFGLAVAGPLADLWGISFWYLLSGAVLTLVGVAAFFVPAIMRLEESHPRPIALEREAAPAPDPAVE
jgi:DHA3 family macrolide efflux protein-like MFS transporter